MERLWLFDPSGAGDEKWKPPADGRVFREIRSGSQAPGAVEDGKAQAVAYVERTLSSGGAEEYRKARGDGTRAFGLWADPYRRQCLAQVVTQPGGGRVATYEVLGPAGEQLALVTRQKAFAKGRIRTRWSVQQPGQRAAVGVKGRVIWYVVWWLLSPVWAFLAFGSDVVPRIPVRTRWKLDGRRVLDWRGDGLNVLSDGWDPRVLAALVALMTSHSGFVKDAWDDSAE
jgi:hypothetical protein